MAAGIQEEAKKAEETEGLRAQKGAAILPREAAVSNACLLWTGSIWAQSDLQVRGWDNRAS